MNLSLLALALISLPSLAIETKNCPASVKVTVSGLSITKSQDQIVADQGGHSLEAEVVAAINQALVQIRNTPSVTRTFAISQAKAGRCVYKGQDEEKVEIYTEQGQNRLYLQTKIGPRGILLRTYAAVLTVEPKRVALAESAPVLTLAVPRYPYQSYSAGGALSTIGAGKAFKIVSK